eukprot:TRINITY_DN16940_c0_g2_i1.p1 TRINITY_DN16940_c0_g2~~TRINITY_DN16940_c0_g2_i1.p1  ORF type:complete len:366 (+),score=104.74 TRINITY_DN16940_c0_g2_i1:58-1155(+)
MALRTLLSQSRTLLPAQIRFAHSASRLHQKLLSRSVLGVSNSKQSVRHFSQTTSPVPTPVTPTPTPAPDALNTILTSAPAPAEATQQVAAAASGMDAGTITNTVSTLIDFLHTFSGTSWAVTIISLALGSRFLFLPIYVKQIRNSLKLQQIQPYLEKIREEAMNAQRAGSMTMQDSAKMQAKMQEVFDRAGVSMFGSFKYAMLQAPIWLLLFLGLRNLGNVAPSLAQEGFLWIDNLALPDPYFGLPIVIGASLLANFELGGDGVAKKTMGNKMWLLRGMAVFLTWFSTTFPSSVVLYWTFANFFSLGFTLLNKRPAFRKLLKLPLPGEKLEIRFSPTATLPKRTYSQEEILKAAKTASKLTSSNK